MAKGRIEAAIKGNIYPVLVPESYNFHFFVDLLIMLQ